MAFNLGDIFVTFKAKTDDLKKGTNAVKDMANQAETFGQKMSASFNRSADQSKKLLLGVAAVGAGVVAFGVSSVKAFQDSENKISQTNAVLKSTGNIAGVTADQVTKLASSLERQTKFSDEDVRSVENLLLTFTSIGKDIFPQATKTVLDMATALGEDTSSASIQLGKALQDPVLGITALRRVGVNFNDKQKEVIQHLVDTGKSAEAQRLILKELNREFGGSATAAGNTFSGSLAKIKNQFNNIQEAIGQTIVKALGPLVNWFANLITKVQDAGGLLAVLQGYWDRNKDKIIAIAGAIAGALVPGIISLGIALARSIMAFTTALGPWAIAGAAVALIIAHWGDITKIFGGVIDWIVGKWQQFDKHFNAVAKDVQAFASSVLGFFKRQLDKVVDGWQAVDRWLVKHQKGLKNLAEFLSVIFGPLLIKLAAQAVWAGAQMAWAALTAGTAWTINAIKSAAAWTWNFGIMTAQAIYHGTISAAQAVWAGGVWTVQAVKTGAVWLYNFAIMAAQAIWTGAVFVAQAVAAGIAWVIALGPVALAIGVVAALAFLIIKNWSTVKGWFMSLWDWFKKNWTTLLAILFGPFGLAVKMIIQHWGTISGFVKGIVDKIVGWFKDLPGRMGGFVGKVASTVMSPFKTAFNAIARFWNDTVGKLSFQAPSWIPHFGGKGWSMPKLPTLAMGTPDWKGGMVTVGEFGREDVYLPKGAQVVPASKSGKNSGGDTNIFNLQGVFARTETELADMMEKGLQALDRKRIANGKPAVLGGRA